MPLTASQRSSEMVASAACSGELTGAIAFLDGKPGLLTFLQLYEAGRSCCDLFLPSARSEER
jgi:hypothetical protein